MLDSSGDTQVSVTRGQYQFSLVFSAIKRCYGKHGEINRRSFFAIAHNPSAPIPSALAKHTAMAWLLGSKEAETPKPPSRSSRQRCWGSRDKFFACLDKIGVDNALDDSKQADIKANCSAQEASFEADCAKSWVKYFKEQRFYAIKKERFLKEMEQQGGTEIPIGKPAARK